MMKAFSALALSLFLSGSLMAAPALAQTNPCAAGASLDTRLAAALARPDRPAGQKAADATRASENRFLFSYIHPGDHVLDLGAGGGYASMLLSAAVCGGSVDSQNPAQWDKTPEARATMAQARPNIHLLEVDFDKVPVPATPYDAIFIGTIYHDTYNMPGANGGAMDKALYATLKPSGLVILVDHAAARGAGTTQTNTLHRIDKQVVLDDFKAAGFDLIVDSDALANPADDHTLKVFDPLIRGHTDRMALVFKKPE
ncbi:methyltransferase [Asticcacaulis sp. EMRT-3]|uniref:methyltransferase n=1 Tax=Asticcacaulis sp. EMRT-3 TaxID=3040349 RepID=UPI0024AF014F|nr:methyltransferase [Asticcacaulis sp. EMRT-3]MDI7774918.1 methyltransferase [Asticcacaulis sp. EMRT-3]